MRIEVTDVEPAFDGKSFGSVGAYEKVTGRAWGSLDRANPSNAGIVNLEFAPADADGLVHFECDFVLLRPKVPGCGNGALLYDVLNRGNKVALHSFNDAPRDASNPQAMSVNDPSSDSDAGNGFLMRQGFSLLWSGWQGAGVMGGDHLMSARLPVAQRDGKPITGINRDEFIFEHTQNPIVAPLSYPAASLGSEACTLTVRQRERDQRQPLSASAWRFISDKEIEIDRPDEFDAGAIYEFIYPARDPIVMGMGLAAVRDLVSFFRHDDADENGTPNPLRIGSHSEINRAIAFGMSQAGRFLRDFLYQGFNEDVAGRKVFDGVFASMAGARRTFVNHAFAQPGRFSRQHEDRLYPHGEFPFSYATTTDPVSGLTDGLLARCRASDTCPKIMQTESSSDFFHGRASLLLTDGKGGEIAVPEDVRLYHFASMQHGGGGATANFARNFPFTKHPLNPADFPGVHRALLLALDRWIVTGALPPPSMFPSVRDGSLVAADRENYGFPAVPGVIYPGLVNGLRQLDHGAQPPTEIDGQDYAIKVPSIDDDGNEIAGIRVPEIAVPRGTHTGWAPRKAGFAGGELIALGAYFPFAMTRAEQAATGDPRPSIEERYSGDEEYLRKIGEVARKLCAQGLLLEEDIGRIIAQARERIAAENGVRYD